MLVSELKRWPKLYEACKDQWDWCWRGVAFGDNADIDDAFPWDDSEEGWEFWCMLEGGHIEAAKELCPELFEDEIDIEE